MTQLPTGEKVSAGNKFYIRGFDGLRAISIAFVVITHLGWYDGLLQTDPGTRLWHTISGDAGVTLFFVISGFLITTILLREQAARGTISYRNFLTRRLIRLLPPLIVFYVLIAVMMLYGNLDYKPLALLASIAYLYNFLPNKYGLTELTHTWSLAVEEQFYLCWPWVIYFSRRNGILVIALLLLLLSLIAVAMLPGISIHYQNKQYIISNVIKVQRFFIPAIAPIMSGCIFAVLNFYYNSLVIKSTSGIIPLTGAALLACAAFWLPVSLFPYLLIMQSLGYALLLSNISNNQFSQMVAMLEWQPLAFIGTISYSIYVWQGLFLRTGSGGSLWIQQFPQNLLLTAGAALASYYLVEKRTRRWRQKFA